MPHTHRHPALPLSGLNLRHSPSAQRPHSTQHSAPAAAFCTRSIRPRVCAHPARDVSHEGLGRARQGACIVLCFWCVFARRAKTLCVFVFLNPKFVVLSPRKQTLKGKLDSSDVQRHRGTSRDTHERDTRQTQEQCRTSQTNLKTNPTHRLTRQTTPEPRDACVAPHHTTTHQTPLTRDPTVTRSSAVWW